MVEFQSAGLLRVSWIWGAWTPPDCIQGPRPGLTVPQPLGPCCNLGERALLSGVPTVGLWGPEAAKLSRGSTPGLVPPPSWLLLCPPGPSHLHRRPGGYESPWGLLSGWWGMCRPQPSLAKGAVSGASLVHRLLRKQIIINIPIPPLKKKSVLNAFFFLKISSVRHNGKK